MRQFELIAVQCHPPWCQLVINSNVGRILYCFQDIDAYSYTAYSIQLIFPTPPLFDAPTQGNPL